MEKLNYCSYCASPLNFKDKHYYCHNCNKTVYFDPKVAVASIITKKKSAILLVKRAIGPSIGKWSFPSGFVDRGERLENALIREVREEINLLVKVTDLIGVYSYQDNPVILCAFEAEVLSGEIRMNDEISGIKEFSLEELPNLAFKHDRQIINDWKKIKNVN